MKRSERMLLAALGIAAVALIFLLVALGTFLVRTHRAGGRTQAQKQALEERLRTLEAQSASAREWSEAPTAYARFLTSICYPLADFPALRREIRDLFTRSAIEPTGTRYTTARVMPGLVRASVHFSLDAPYPELKKWLYEIERHPRLLFIRSAQLSASTSGPTLNGQFVMEAYLGE